VSIKLLNQIQSEVLCLESAWDSDLRPSKDDAVVQLDELESDAGLLGSEGESVLLNIVQLRARILSDRKSSW
jgi:hypothetical protein